MSDWAKANSYNGGIPGRPTLVKSGPDGFAKIPATTTRFPSRHYDHYIRCTSDQCNFWCIRLEKAFRHERRNKGHVVERVNLSQGESLPEMRR
jgi:hypothetical protein